MGVTQVYTLGDSVGFELNDGSVLSIKYSNVNEGLLELLYNLATELGRVPTFEDVLIHPKMPHPNTYSFYFGSFTKATEIVEEKIEFRKWQESSSSTKPEKGEKKMPKKSLTDDQILELLHDIVIKLGRLPSQKEINGDPELPSYPTISRRFGNKKQLETRLKEFFRTKYRTNDSQPETEPTDAEDIERATDLIIEALTNPELSSSAQAALQPPIESDKLNEPNESSGPNESDELNGPNPVVDENEVVTSEPNRMTVELNNVDGAKTINLVITLKISLSK